MDDKKTKKYIICSSIYFLGVIGTLLFQQVFGEPLKMNEIGDYFAGLIAPLAFLWFVMAYFKQSQDVKQNAEALRMQAEELKNTVEEMKQANEIANDQKKIVMANEAHTRRDVFLQLQEVLVKNLLVQVESIIESTTSEFHGFLSRIDKRFESEVDRSRDRVSAFAILKKILNNSKKFKILKGRELDTVLGAIQNYFNIYNMLIEEAKKVDSQSGMLLSLYEDGEIGSLYCMLQKELPKLQGRKQAEELEALNKTMPPVFAEIDE